MCEENVMDARYRHTRGAFIFLIIILTQACSAPDAIVIIPTITATPVSTNTPLPPLPDFDQILDFGLGGGGDPGCIEYPGYRPAFTIERNWYCLWGVVKPGESFQIELVSPDGKTFQSNNLWIETSTDAEHWIGSLIYWEGYPGFDQAYHRMADIVEVFLLLPPNPASGQWKAKAHATGFQISVEFNVVGKDKPSITALNPHSEDEILPVDFYASQIFDLHPLRLKDNGKVDVIGNNYPVNEPIFILLYRETSRDEFTLIHKQSLFSDSIGSFSTELSGPFEPGQSYLVYGVSDPSVNFHDFEEPDYFKLMPVINTSSDCPGAPPQRMSVNQNGYVCTQKDRVNIRGVPNESSTAIDFMMPNNRFLIIGGPQCADSQSWWQIQTNWGTTGWVSEGGDETDPYFICPLK
jgi:hypothetical protein